MRSFYNNPIWKALRVIVLKRDNRRCLYCHNTKNLHVHHIKPLSMGGQNELFNLIILCSSCHGKEHGLINRYGCFVIPGPEWECYRELITIPEDVNRYRDYLIKNGFEPEF